MYCIQDRVTEHRLGVTVWGISDFMNGTDSLNDLIEQLNTHYLQQNLADWLQ